jgi:hypothetical protein
VFVGNVLLADGWENRRAILFALAHSSALAPTVRFLAINDSGAPPSRRL